MHRTIKTTGIKLLVLLGATQALVAGLGFAQQAPLVPLKPLKELLGPEEKLRGDLTGGRRFRTENDRRLCGQTQQAVPRQDCGQLREKGSRSAHQLRIFFREHMGDRATRSTLLCERAELVRDQCQGDIPKPAQRSRATSPEIAPADSTTGLNFELWQGASDAPRPTMS